MNKKQSLYCNLIIHAASALSAGVGGGLAQLPVPDSTLLKPIQLGMTVALGRVFNVSVSKSYSKAAAGSSTAKAVGRPLSRTLARLIPGIGNVINASTAATITEVIGWKLAKEFERSSCMCSGTATSYLF